MIFVVVLFHYGLPRVALDGVAIQKYAIFLIAWVNSNYALFLVFYVTSILIRAACFQASKLFLLFTERITGLALIVSCADTL